MNRRKFVTTSITTVAASVVGSLHAMAGSDQSTDEAKGLVIKTTKLRPSSNELMRVAIVMSEGVNVVDFSGPWGVFENVSVSTGGFQPLAVAETMDIVTSPTGLRIQPNYTFANVPDVKVVVIPAQKGSDGLREWLKKISESADVTMSVCTGAFQLAKAGLLNGKPATTHHKFLDRLEKSFPEVQVKRGVRFVEGEKISTAAGLTSGTDLALRVVERYYGRKVAQETAAEMEYQGMGWVV
jgi:transcriptional regulator GlxA family with amidase domain